MQDILFKAISLARRASYDYSVKTDWLRMGRSVLVKLATDLSLPKGSYEIRAIKGGIAVSGEMILHHDKFYVNLSNFGVSGAGFARTCQGQKDYTGGRNITVPVSYGDLLVICKNLLDKGEPQIRVSRFFEFHHD